MAIGAAFGEVTACATDDPLRGRVSCTVRSDAGDAVASVLDVDAVLAVTPSALAETISIVFACSLFSVACLVDTGDATDGGEFVEGATRDDEAIDALSLSLSAVVVAGFGEGRFWMTLIRARFVRVACA